MATKRFDKSYHGSTYNNFRMSLQVLTIESSCDKDNILLYE